MHWKLLRLTQQWNLHEQTKRARDPNDFPSIRRELEDGANVFSAISAVRKRGKDKAGDYENKYKIMSDFRAYSNRDLLDTDHFGVAPTLDDLSGQLPDRGKVIWVTGPFRLFV